MKSYLKRIGIVVLGIILIPTIKLRSQSPDNLPKVIPPSPIASTFTIYGDYPVSHSTGVPDIQIPLYSFKCGDIEVPITLKYHIGSAKPSPYGIEMSSIGYGWVLETGGIVTRTVVGKQDESGKMPTDSINRNFDQSNETDYNFLREVSTRQIDTEYDIFSYNFSNNHGNFVIEKNNEGNFDAINFPYKPYKFLIYTTGSGANKLISSVKIKDDNGFDYVFSDIESNGYLNTGWYLSQIHSPSNRIVNYVYNDRSLDVNPGLGPRKYYYSVNDYYTGFNVQYLPTPLAQPDISMDPSTIDLTCETKIIKKIYSDSDTVVFELDKANSLIKNFVVKNSIGETIKTIVFHQSKFDDSVYVRLDYIEIQDNLSNKVQKYSFEYNSNSVLNSQNVDYWGGYNGVSSSSHLPYTEFPYYFSTSGWGENYSENRNIGSNDRCVDINKILAQTLAKIIYPTGGSTEFTFEPNEYTGASACSNEHIGAGLRIKSIINKDNQKVTSTKTYQYQPGILRFDRFNPIHYTHYSYSISNYCGVGFVDYAPGFTLTRSRTFSEDMNSEILDYYIRYSSVTEYFGNDQSNIGKNIYSYSFDNNHDYKTSSFLYDNSVVLDRYKDWGNGLLRDIETYRKESNNSYSKVKEINYQYSFFNADTLYNLRVFRLSTYPQDVQCYNFSHSGELDIRNFIISLNNNPIPPFLGLDNFPTPPFFGLNNYYIQTGGYVPTKSIETFFYPDTISTLSRNYYGKGYEKYVTKTAQYLSKSDSLVKVFKYPYDFKDKVFQFCDTVALKLMVESNQINHVVELTEKIRNDSIKTRTSYRDWENGIFAPDSILTAVGTERYEPRINFINYDNKGNLMSVSKANDLNINYLWGYNKTYPVAKIENTSFGAIETAFGGTLPDLGIGGLNSTQISTLRTQLPNALISTYTYEPMIGMTSQTDPNGITTYYEYDSFGRLEYVRDNNNKIIKHIEYNYR